MLNIIPHPDKKSWSSLLQRPLIDYSTIDPIVKHIMDDVRKKGDKALYKYSMQFDKVQLKMLMVPQKDIYSAASLISPKLSKAIDIAAKNIFAFHSAQYQRLLKLNTMPGVCCWQKAVAIEKVGLYVPGGTASLFSTVLMLGIPAVIAGCKEIVLCTPPAKNGSVDPAILYAAWKVGINKIFTVGGVQAIAAMAYGTESIPATDKIFGPGNQYVTAAKQLAARQQVAIDMPAGPSEVAIMADNSCKPAFVAADLLSQAEHGNDSQVLLVTTSKSLVDKVIKQLKYQIDSLPRKKFARQSLKNSKAIIVKNTQTMIDLVNTYAPEHLIISLKNYAEVAEKIVNAGSVFLGNYTPESSGDYASGTNHTLPTNGYARMYSGVNLDSYMKKITFQELSPAGLKNIGPHLEVMALTEQLHAHANAVSIRLQSVKKKKNERAK